MMKCSSGEFSYWHTRASTSGAPFRPGNRNARYSRAAFSPSGVGSRSPVVGSNGGRSEEHTSELQSPCNLVCRLLLEKKKNTHYKARLRRPDRSALLGDMTATVELLPKYGHQQQHRNSSRRTHSVLTD